MQQERSDLLDRLGEAEALAGPVVEFGGDPVQVGGAVEGEVGAVGEVLAQSPLVFSLVARCQGACGSQK
jgi:hypothetical protein